MLGLILYSTRTLQIYRGLKLDSYIAGEVTYDVWSYGNWIESNQSGVHVSTFAPPYTVVLAIRPSDRNIASIEMLDAFIVEESGNKTPVFDKIKQSIADVKFRSAAVIKLPYAVFTFDSMLDSNDSTTLVIEFRINRSGVSEKTQQSLEIQSFESKRRSFVFLDAISSVLLQENRNRSVARPVLCRVAKRQDAAPRGLDVRSVMNMHDSATCVGGTAPIPIWQ